jgi:hypothetical protein
MAYTNDALYNGIAINDNSYNMVNEFNSRGFLTAFLYHTKDLAIQKPAGYSKNAALGILRRYENMAPGAGMGTGADAGGETGVAEGTAADSGAKTGMGAESGARSGAGTETGSFRPDIVMIMSEAFWDITQVSALAPTGGADPLENFHRLEKESIAGDLYVSSFGGGTDTTEFNALTGNASANLGANTASAYKILIRRSTDSIAWALKREGYSAVALHPGYGWFYNRINVYKWLGFDQFIDGGAFGNGDIYGNYVSDEAMERKLLETYNAHTGGGSPGGNPFFGFIVSIQNHGPYDGGWMYGELPPNYALAPGVELSQGSIYALTNYIHGLYCADRSLGRLADYFEQCERPVAIVFFGDHLPSLGYNFQTYSELGYPIGYGNVSGAGLQAKLNTYRAPYLIWANAEARAQWDEYGSLAAPPRNQMSANYLGYFLLDRLGMDSGAYQNFLMSAYGKLPVYGKYFSSSDNRAGHGFSKASPEYLENMLDEYKIVQYYKMFGESIGE